MYECVYMWVISSKYNQQYHKYYTIPEGVQKAIENGRRWVPRDRTEPSSGCGTHKIDVVDTAQCLPSVGAHSAQRPPTDRLARGGFWSQQCGQWMPTQDGQWMPVDCLCCANRCAQPIDTSVVIKTSHCVTAHCVTAH